MISNVAETSSSQWIDFYFYFFSQGGGMLYKTECNDLKEEDDFGVAVEVFNPSLEQRGRQAGHQQVENASLSAESSLVHPPTPHRPNTRMVKYPSQP